MFTHTKVTLQMLPRDNPRYFRLFCSGLFTAVTNFVTVALNIVSFAVFVLIREKNILKYLRAIHAVEAGVEKVFHNRPEITYFRFSFCHFTLQVMVHTLLVYKVFLLRSRTQQFAK